MFCGCLCLVLGALLVVYLCIVCSGYVAGFVDVVCAFRLCCLFISVVLIAWCLV